MLKGRGLYWYWECKLLGSNLNIQCEHCVYVAGVPRAASRRRALAPLGARTGTRTASVHSAQRALDELQPPVAAASLWRGVWGARGCAAGAQRGRRAHEAAKTAASAPPAAVADYRVVGGLVGVAEGVCDAGMVARGRFVGAVPSYGARA